MNKFTACPLDCYDSCEIIYKDSKIKAVKNRHTKGFLCSKLNKYLDNEIITKPRYLGKEISKEELLLKLKEIISTTLNNRTLYYKGSGNFGLMQEITEHFFSSYGATLTDGNLCDGAGEFGIIEGRGSNKNLSISEVEKSDVIIVWGRNPHTTSTHLLPLLKNKTIIVIDPVKTEIAKKSDLHIQLKPQGDLSLALLLSRFLVINDDIDEEYLNKFASEYKDFYELTQTVRIKATIDDIGVSLGEIGKLLELVKNKKTSIVCGVGIQKYKSGAEVMRAIDAFAVMLCLFGKEGSGVVYLGDSKDGIEPPFHNKSKRVSKVDTLFSNFDTVFIQGANPLAQMPNSLRVKKSIEKVKNIIYFGLHENETSEIADLVIPAKTFLHKNDIRTSYSHTIMIDMPKILDTDIGISEYNLTRYLCDEFDIKLEKEEFYIEHFKKFTFTNENGSLSVKNREEIPYKNGFDTDDGKFEFLEEYDKFISDNKLYLITSKSKNSLNSQFKRDKYVYLNSSLGYEEDEEITISSSVGKVTLKVKYNNDLRDDCILIYSGTKGVNNLTSSQHSFDGKNAIYQELRVEIINN